MLTLACNDRMQTILFIIACCCLVVAVNSAEIPNKLLDAIHFVESSRRLGPIVGDDGNALGPFQIHKNYWKDSGIAGDYSQCADYNYSKRVVRAYLTRYGREFIKKNDLQALARIHNGGPHGHKNPNTLKYWTKVHHILLISN